MSMFESIQPGDDSRKNWRTINKLGGAFSYLERRTDSLEHPSQRRVITGSRAGGWNFHEPLAYDSAVQYARNDIVFVGEDNAAVVDGVEQPDETVEYTTAGLWVCFRFPRVTEGDPPETTIHVPMWANPTEAEVEDVYWIPIWVIICP